MHFSIPKYEPNYIGYFTCLFVPDKFATFHFSDATEERTNLFLSHILWQVVYD